MHIRCVLEALIGSHADIMYTSKATGKNPFSIIQKLVHIISYFNIKMQLKMILKKMNAYWLLQHKVDVKVEAIFTSKNGDQGERGLPKSLSK